MPVTRRSILSLVGAAALSRPALAAAAAAAPDPYGARGLGAASAPVVVHEYFSLTCTHCAYFATSVMPRVKTDFVDTGKLRMVYHDFPLDQVALKAAQVARYLPADQYYPFIEALFASQGDWAFEPNEDYHASIFRYAVLAGMDKATYEIAWNDAKLAQFIINEETSAQKQYNIEATPSFVIDERLHTGVMEYGDIAALVAKAAGG